MGAVAMFLYLILKLGLLVGSVVIAFHSNYILAIYLVLLSIALRVEIKKY